MGVKNKFSVYPLNDMIEVESESTTIVKLWDIPANTSIEKVWVRMKRAAIRAAGAVTLTIGDTATANGYITAADAKGTPGTVYGNTITEIGANLAELVESGATDHNQIVPAGKLYTAPSELRLVLSAVILTTDTEAIVQVFIKGKRFEV